MIDEDLARNGRRDATPVPLTAIDAGVSFPYLRLVSLPFYHDRGQLAKVTCIQITETRLFFVWDAMYKPENIEFFRARGLVGGGTPPGGSMGGGESEVFALGPGQN